MNFEKALDELERIVTKMETGQLSLEDSLHCFEQGIKLTSQCQTALKEAEQTVKILVQKNENEATLADFPADMEV